MQFPLTFWDVSLWLAIIAIILLVTVELTSPYYGQTNLKINKKRLKRVALATVVLFMITVAIRIASIILNL